MVKQRLRNLVLGLLLTAGESCGVPNPLFAVELNEASILEAQIKALEVQQKTASDQFEQGAKLKGQGALMQQAAQDTFQTLAASLAELQHKLDEVKKPTAEHNPKKDSTRKN